MAPSRKLAALYYEIEARTKGLDRDLNAAQRSFGKLSEFVLKNPVQAIGAVGTALAAIAVKAQRMAEEVEKGMRRVETAVSGSAQGFKQLRADIEDMSIATGRSQAELAGAAAEIAKSVGTVEEVGQRLNAVLLLSQATGEDLSAIIDGLDQVMDTFSISADRAAVTVGALYAAAKGRMPITDLFAAIQAAAPALVQMGIDLETGARALAALGDQGLSARQAARELKALSELGSEGAQRIQELADEIPALVNGLDEATAAADRMNNATWNLTKRLAAGLGSVMVALGRQIDKVVNPFLQANVNLLDILTGRYNAAAEAAKGLADASKGTPTGLANPITVTAVGGETAADIRKRQEAQKKAVEAAKKHAEDLKRIAERQLKDELDAVHKALDAQVDARKKANTQIFEAQKDAAKKLAELAGDTVAVLNTELEETVAQFKALGASDVEIDRITKPLQVALTSAEGLKGALGHIELPKSIAKDLADNAKALKDAEKAAADYEKQMEEAHRATVRVADAIADIGNALFSVAGALGVVSQETQNIARGAINVGTGIAKGNWLQVAAGVGDIITGITAGNRERQQQHQEALARLEAIAKHTGDLVGKNVTGNQLTQARSVAGAVLASGETFSGGRDRTINLAAVLQRLGVTFEEMQAIAAEFGVTLDASTQSWADFKDILDAVDLQAFTDTFDGMLDAAAAARRIFGTQSPLKELEDTAKILAKFSPEFAKIFEGLDLTKAEDRAAALERVMAAFDTALAGGADLGDLNLSQFLDGLGDIGDLIRGLIPELEAVPPPLTEAEKQLQAFTKAMAAFNLGVEQLDLADRFGDLSADEMLDGLIKAFGASFPDAVAGLDFSTIEGFKETAGLLIDSLFADGELTDAEREQIRVLELLLTAYEGAAEAAEAAANAAVSLADALSSAFQDIDLDAAIFGTDAQDTFNKKFQAIIGGLTAPEGTGGFQPGGGFDLSTQAGRDEARAALQGLALSDPSLKPLIANLIHDLDSLPDLPSDIADALAEKASASDRTSVSAGLQQLTIYQGDRLITLGESKLLRLTQIRDLIAGATATRSQVLQPPPIGAFLGAGFGSSSNVQQGSLSVSIAVNVPSAVTEPKAIAELTVNRLLADAMVRDRFLGGSGRVL